MAKNLSDLFGSALDESVPLSLDAAASASSASASTGKFAGGLEVSQLTASTAWSTITGTEAVLTRVLYYSGSEDQPYCLGVIGGDNKKFCCSFQCKINKHEASKFIPKPGLFIKVPKKIDQAFTSPFLLDQLLEPELLELFIEAENLSKSGRQFFLR